MMRRRARWAGAVAAAALVLAGCSDSDDSPLADAAADAASDASASPSDADSEATVVQTSTKIQIPEELAGLDLGATEDVADGGAGQTLVRDPESGAIYMAWLRQVPDQEVAEDEDPASEIVVAVSEDDGESWSEPVTASAEDQTSFYTATANPAQGAIGPDGEYYLVYTITEESELSSYGASLSYFTRSTDGGETFSDPIQMVTDEEEGLEPGIGTSYMNNLYVAKDGDLFYSFLDEREAFEAKKKELEAGEDHSEHSGHGSHGEEPATQLRITRSADGGETWSQSSLVGKPVCGCCGTAIAENAEGELIVGTRAAFQELEGSYDAVRDIVLASSDDDGQTWSELRKVHDDGFKISGCPDIAMGLATDSEGLMHVAWYTGTESHPGVFYAQSEDGKTWTKPVALLHGDWAPYADVRLVIDGDDQPWVAFEDRSGDTDMVQIARIDPEQMKVSFSQAVEGRGPALTVGDGWALMTFESLPADEQDEGPFALNSVIARIPTV